MRALLYRTLVALRALPPPQPMTWESFFGQDNTLLAGVSIDESNALNYSPVWCGVTTLSRDIAKLPLMFYRNLPNGGKEPFKEHRLYRILHDEPNPEMSSFKFRETMQALCLLYGNAYAEIVRDDLRRPVGMYPIVPTRVQPMRNDAGRLFYRVTLVRGGQSDVQAANMLHLSSLSTDGILGHGIVQHARESFGLGVAAEKFGAAFFGNGTTFGGVVEVPGSLKGPEGEQTKDNIRKLIEAVHAGVERAHKILVLGAGSKFTERGTNPNEAQYNETRKFQITETARWLTMPPHKLGDLENAHFTNIEEENIQYHVGTVSGWLEMWEQELTRKLVSPLEYSQQTIEHNTEGALRGDSTKRADFYSKMYAIGAFSINDILRKENMNPIGLEGDMHLVPLNMIPAERYGEWIDATIEAKKAPPQKALPAAPDGTIDPTIARMEDLKTEIRTALARAEEHVTRAVAAEAKAAHETEHAATWQATAAQEQAAARTAADEARTAKATLAELQASYEQAVRAQAEESRQREETQQRLAAAEEARAAVVTVAEQRAAEVAEARTQLATAVAERERAETSASEVAAALAKADEARHTAESARLAAAAMAEQRAADVADATTRLESALVQLAQETARAESVVQERTVALTDAEHTRQTAEAARMAAVELADQRSAQAAEAQEQLATALARLAQETARADAVAQERAAFASEADQARQAAELARLAAVAVAEQRAAHVADAESRLATALAELAQETSRAEAIAQERAAALTEAERATQALVTREHDLEAAHIAIRSAETSAAGFREVRDQLDANLTTRKAAELDRLTRVVAAHRALIVDVVVRMIRPEVDRARRRQGTPESLRKWADAFYQTHRDVCADALYPAILTHLAWKRSDEDARVVARSLADAHCALSEQQLDTVLTGAEPDEFHAALEQLLLRWEQERPSLVADTILADEIRYIRSLS